MNSTRPLRVELQGPVFCRASYLHFNGRPLSPSWSQTTPRYQNYPLKMDDGDDDLYGSNNGAATDNTNVTNLADAPAQSEDVKMETGEPQEEEESDDSDDVWKPSPQLFLTECG